MLLMMMIYAFGKTKCLFLREVGRCINGRALEEEFGLGGCVARLS
jgi:hypothetical protein